MRYTEYDVDTGIFDKPGLQYPAVAGITGLGAFFVPINLTSYQPADHKTQVTQIGVMPVISGFNTSVGAGVVGVGAASIPRISMEGHIDTPCDEMYSTDGLLMNVPSPKAGTVNITYADFIIMCFEGRANTSYIRVDPLWFRDPYGRQFNSPKLLDFTASYVEAVPGRTSFTMQLKV